MGNINIIANKSENKFDPHKKMDPSKNVATRSWEYISLSNFEQNLVERSMVTCPPPLGRVLGMGS